MLQSGVHVVSTSAPKPPQPLVLHIVPGIVATRSITPLPLTAVTGGNGESDVADQKLYSNLEELEQFAKYFKRRRIEFGLTQGDVGLAMGKIYDYDFSQTTISRFEALNLSLRNMSKLKPLLEKWLLKMEDSSCVAATATATPEKSAVSGVNGHDFSRYQTLHRKRRKKRTNIDSGIRQELERYFLENSKPNMEELCALAVNLSLQLNVVRVWFCNRRQKAGRYRGVGDTNLTCDEALNKFGLCL